LILTDIEEEWSKFFYCAKISTRERNINMPEDEKNNHPTVKTIKLMSYLINLITPPNGIVLDPFMGSGTTGIACKQLGFDFIGIELNTEYYEIAKKRVG
jgi:DNA modification methylase